MASTMSRLRAAILTCCAAAFLAAAPVPAAAQPSIDGPLPQPLPLFPADNWWNVDISGAPLDPNSAAFIQFINTRGDGSVAPRSLHPDFAGSAHEPDDPQLIYGIPYISVPGSQPRIPVTFVEYPAESDNGAPGAPAGYPIPEEAKFQPGWMEAGAPASEMDGPLDSSNGDRHMLIVDRDNRLLYELYRAHWNTSRSRWEAGSGAVFPLTSNLRRPDGWTSADAAGLAILPGLIRWDEVNGTAPIRHALRMTVRRTNGYVFPASHRAGDTAGALPMGARLRLRANVDISGYPAPMQRLFQAMKTYGLIVADNGSDMYITGTSDPRWDSQMDGIVSAFRSLSSSQFDVVQLGWTPPVTADADRDTLPDEWETQYGLDITTGVGDDGPDGDPDHDGQTNAQELAADTHPTGHHQDYFAEGASNEFFTTRFALLNPGDRPAHVQLRYLQDGGTIVRRNLTIPARTRATEDPALSVGPLGAFATTIESDEPIVADRTMIWDRTGYGATAETARPALSTQWYFAEGATSPEFSLFYLIENPHDRTVDVTIRYLLRGAPSFELPYQLLPNSRTTIPVGDQDPRLRNADISAVISSQLPVIAERAMYRTGPGRPAMEAGHASAGVTAPKTRWFLAEGATGFFSLFVLVANPGPDPAELTITYLLPNGPPRSRTMRLPGFSRETIAVETEVLDGVPGLLAATPVSTIVHSTNNVPIVVERAMWWPAGNWYEAHNSPGATTTSLVWASAEGETGGQYGAQSYYLIANTSPTSGRARVRLMFEYGTEASATVDLPPNSRTTVDVADPIFGPTANRRFGLTITSLPPLTGGTPAPDLVVERAMYWNANGLFWGAGTNALLTPLPTAAP